ncbi:MAG TPA: type II secretion system protein GspC [Candidatus Binataceae bacterium]|nr:type II secretion system protein GspC [Candidatus Binataceae bacterium]
MQFRFLERYIPILNFILVGAIAYFAALSADDLIARKFTSGPAAEPPSMLTRRDVGAQLSRASYSAIVDRDVFNAAKPAPEPVAPAPITLHIKLLGTSELTSEKPFAVIEDDQSHQQALYRLGDDIPDAGILVSVQKTRVLINHDGQIMSLEISGDNLPVEASTTTTTTSTTDSSPAGGGVHLTAPNQYTVDRATVDHDLQNMGTLLTQMRALPDIQNGKTDGFKLSEIQQGSLFQQMGLQDGDVVTTISGQAINDPMKALELLNVLQNSQSVAIQIMRNGQPMNLNYSIR